MSVYKQVCYKHDCEGETLNVSISPEGMNDEGFYSIESVEINDLNEYEKEMLLESMVEILQSFKSKGVEND